MHAPDGFLTAGTALATGALSLGAVTLAIRRAGTELGDRQIPLAGVTAAFVFAGQMFNFPVAAGTSGHLLGAALAAILLGPSVGAMVAAIVVLVQALVFADGGLTALGYNTLNMAIVPAFGGYAAFRFLRRVMPASAPGVAGAGALAAGLSVVLSSMAFSLEWLFGASAPVPFDTVFGAMVGVHLLIGIGEAVITGLALSAVLAARPDLVHGAADLDPAQLADRGRIPARVLFGGAVLVIVVMATVVSQFASDSPDGLERVAEDTGFASAGTSHALDHSFFADYATAGVGNASLSLALAGLTGALIVAAVGYGLLRGASVRR